MKQAALPAPAARALRALLVVAIVWLAPATARAARPDDALFRLFLKDGTSVSSYGEFVRVGDRVVFSIQVGETAGQPRLQLVSLEASHVDWPRTDNYSDTVKASRYAASRGEAEFAQLTARVAATLEMLSTTTDPATRLQIVEQMRREVGAWPGSHFGYRSHDVAEIGALLDEAVSEMRAAAGSKNFDLRLVATVEAPKAPLAPPPTPAEAIEQVLGVARHLDVPAERISLLGNALAYIDDSKGTVPKGALARFRRSARRDLQEETDIELAYAALTRRTMTDVSMHAVRGDVRGVEKAFGDIARADLRLGHRRAGQVDVLMARVEEKLETARRIRLTLDQWALRVEACSRYRDEVSQAVRDLVAASASLEDIKKLAGPSVKTLRSVGPRLAAVSLRLGGMTPPAELSAVHGLFQSAAELALQAVLVRQDAIRTGDVSVAWNASSAAAGSMMLLARARGDMDAFFKPPELR